MGRVESTGEARSVASARNAVTIYAVIAVGFAALMWFAGNLVAKTPMPMQAEAVDVARFAQTLWTVIAAVHVLAAVGMQRVWTAAWLAPLVVDSVVAAGIAYGMIQRTSLAGLLLLLLNAWVLSKLFDRDVVRAFRRSGKAVPVPVADEEEWRPPMVTPFPVAQPVAPLPPAAPVAPAAPSRPSAAFDYFGS